MWHFESETMSLVVVLRWVTGKWPKKRSFYEMQSGTSVKMGKDAVEKHRPNRKVETLKQRHVWAIHKGRLRFSRLNS